MSQRRDALSDHRRGRSRRSLANAFMLLMMMLAIVCGSTHVARADDPLGQYLERLRLTRLLAEHLERELVNKTLPEERSVVVERLALVYPDLLEQEQNTTRRDELIARSSAFLDREHPKQADGLRLALLRARYRGAARIAEDFRSRLAEPTSVADAIATLGMIEKESVQLRTRMEQRLKELERKGERTDGLEGERLEDRANLIRGEIQESLGLEAWAIYYRSLLSENRQLAETAQPIFARVLDTGQPYPRPEDVSLDLRSNEFFANAILGMALVKGRTESLAAALAWLQLLDEPQVSDAVRKQLPAWRLVACLERGEWTKARELVRSMTVESGAPAAWLRLAAVGGLNDGGKSRDATNLAREAVSALAARRELGQIADLARRFGDAATGDRGFAASYVRGVLAYEKGRQAKERNDTSAAATHFAEASKHLELALTEPDGGEFAVAMTACRSLAAWSRFERGNYDEAFGYFAAASDAGNGRDEESDWMTLVTLEKMLVTAGAPPVDAERKRTIEGELRQRIDRFLGQHPASDKVPQVLLRRMAISDAPRREDLERILAIDGGSPNAADTKRQATQGFYRLFRTSTGQERIDVGKRFLAEVRKLPTTGGSGGLAGLPDGDITLARQALDVALTPEVDDADYADALLRAIDALQSANAFDATPFRSELIMRHVQADLARHRLASALKQVSDLQAGVSDDAGRAALDLARRQVYRYASARLKDPALPIGDSTRDAIVDATLQMADALLEVATQKAGSLNAALGDRVTDAIAMVALQAATEAVVGGGDRAIGERAIVIAKALTVQRGKDPAVLELTATVATTIGDNTLALESLRQIVAGSPERSERWFRSKVSMLELLAKTDPAQARAVLAQHRQLHPDYGPEPWGSRLKSIESSLPPAPSDANGAGGTRP